MTEVPGASLVEGPALAAQVEGWFTTHVEGCRPPLRLERIGEGRSNLTYLVEDSEEARWVLRRPPAGALLASAHDVVREGRIMGALAGSPVPVPAILAVGAPGDPLDVPCIVMEHLDGLVIADHERAALLDGSARRRVGASLVEGLVAIHAVDVTAVGLGDLSRQEGYLARQLRRWEEQWQATRGDRELPELEEAHDLLVRHMPADAVPPSLVHGDFRLDNCVFDRAGGLVGVLDWELTALGDPLVDLGLLLAYTNEATDPGPPLFRVPSSAPGFPTRAEIVEMYGAASGRDVSSIDYYVVFAFWKLACIVQGVQRRYAAGDMGDVVVQEDRVPRLAAAARGAAARLAGGF